MSQPRSVTLSVDGHTFELIVADDRPELPYDPTIVLYVEAPDHDHQEEPLITIHMNPGCHEGGHITLPEGSLKETN